MKLYTSAGVGRGVVACIAALIVLVLMGSASGWSQSSLGSIVGIVTDQSGAKIPGATVKVLDVQRGVTRTLTTNSGGQYFASGLIPGQYTVTVQAQGFTQFQQENITLLVGQQIRVDARLSLGAQAQTIRVTGAAPQIDTTSSTPGGEIVNRVLSELPVNGRNFQHLLHLVPGVQMKPGGGPNSYVAFGQRNSANTIMLDGLFSVNPNTGNSTMIGGNSGSGGPEQANVLPVDAIQEMDVKQNPKAEYGPRPGMYVNIGLKSGTNDFHGNLFASGRNQALESTNAFLTSKQPESVIQWGASVGGPIKKDKLFFFGDFERDDFSVAAPKATHIPTTATGLGDGSSFPDAIAAMNAAAIPVSQLSLNLAGCTNPDTSVTDPSLISCDASSGIFGNSSSSVKGVSAFPVANVSNNVVAKIDYHPNEKNSIHGEYIFGQGSPTAQNGTRIQPYWRGLYNIRTQIVRADWIWTPNSSWVNDARFGYDRIIRSAQAGDCFAQFNPPDYASMGFVTGTGLCGFPNLSISGFTALGSNLGAYNLPRYFHGDDSVTRTIGNHVVKFGAGVRFTNWTGHSTNVLRGTFSFKGTSGLTALQAFLAGVPNSSPGANSLEVGNTLQDVAWQSYFAFVQDDWRLTPRITLNLGLRWDYEAPMRDANNNMGGFDPTVPSGLFQQTASRSLWNPPKFNWGPRLGVAWDVRGNGKTVIRAGGGVFYTPFIGQEVSIQQAVYAVPTGGTFYLADGSTIQGPGNMQTGVISGASLNDLIQSNWGVNTPIFGNLPTTATISCGNGLEENPSPCQLGTISPNQRMAIIGEWNFGIERQITNNLAVDVEYSGSHGDWGTGALDVNQPTPGTVAGELQRRPYYSQFPWFNQILVEGPNDPSNYNALEARLTERVSHGLSFTAAYTWSHNLTIHGLAGVANPKNVMDSTRPQLDYGNSIYDYRQRFTMQGTYTIPGKRSPLQLLQGWEVSSSLDLLSGLPMSAYDLTSDLSGTGEAADRWNLFGNAADFKAGTRDMLPCYGITGSVFGSTDGCTVEPDLASMPAACVTAATNLPTNPNVPLSDPNATGLDALGSFGCYYAGNSVIVPPAQGTYGNMGVNVLRGQSFRVWNMAFAKNTKIRENINLQLRVEFFNILNLVNYSADQSNSTRNPAEPSTFVTTRGTPDVVSNAPVFGTGGPRKLTLGARITF